MFDAYSRRARLAPLLLAALPAVVLAGIGMTLSGAARVSALLLGVIGLVACGVVRDAGRRLEPGLWARWGGPPTSQRLRWRGPQDVDEVRRLHERVQSIVEQPLPTSSEEAEDPHGADARYKEAVAVLRERTRDPGRYALLLGENTDYGFRRNALGLRPVALAVALLVLAGSFGLLLLGSAELAGRASRWGPSGVVAGLSLVFWARVVTPQWVRLAAERYADRLFEAVATLKREDAAPAT